MNWHITPIDDLEPHEQNTTCKCEPKVQIMDSGDMLIVHNSFDGRELFEEIDEFLNNKKQNTMATELELLKEASNELKYLRSQNNLMNARLDMFDKCVMLLTANVQQGSVGMGEDLVWKIDKLLNEKTSNQ